VAFRKTEYKLTVLGSGGVGKTALTVQMTSSHFVEYYDPTIESSYQRQVVVDDFACVLDILDTAGQDDYSALRSQWIRSGEGYIIMYSITDKTTFAEVSNIRSQILMVRDVSEADAPPMVLVGNKSDLEDRREVPQKEGKQLADMWNCAFFEASAKTKTNVEESFFCLVRKIREVEGFYKYPKEGGLGSKRKNRACALF